MQIQCIRTIRLNGSKMVDPEIQRKVRHCCDELLYEKAFRSASILEKILQNFQIHTIQHPQGKSRIRKVVKIYEESSMLANFDSENVGISKHEFAELLIPLMGIAATQGPKHLIEVAMGQKPIPEYKEGIDTSSINQTDVWDQLDLNDEKEVHAYLLECGRLNQPVGHSHRVAEEDFTVNIMGEERTFPKGTVISIPINMSCVNKNLYGDNVFKFDHKRMNLFDYSTIFHSVGMRHAGRRCPGARFALDMLSEIVVKCGEVRRNMV